MQRARRDSFNARLRGAAYAEALLVILFAGVIWCSIVYVTRLHSARQRARLGARHCAWVIAVAGCREIPEECRGSGRTRGTPSPRLQKELSGAFGTRGDPPGDDADRIASNARQAVDAEVEGLIFERISVEQSRSVRRPLRYGGGTIEVGASYTLPCNSRPTSVASHARDLFRKIVERVF